MAVLIIRRQIDEFGDDDFSKMRRKKEEWMLIVFFWLNVCFQLFARLKLVDRYSANILGLC